MDKYRPIKSYNTLEQIINALMPGRVGNNQTYIGKQYTKSSLIKDLKKINHENKTNMSKFIRCEAARGGLQCTEEKGHIGRHKLPHAHKCHFPTCNEEVPPKLWGCKKHWFKLPSRLRGRIWVTYKAGQEITKTPSNAYMKVALEVQDWCLKNPDV